MKAHLSAPTFDVELIDKGHARLFDLERRLLSFCGKGYSACDACGIDTQDVCEKPFRDLFDELMVVMWEHFREEESLMVHLPAEPAQAHRYEHAEISKLLSGLAEHGQQSALLRNRGELSRILHRWLHEHIDSWDMPLVRQIRRNVVNDGAPM